MFRKIAALKRVDYSYNTLLEEKHEIMSEILHMYKAKYIFIATKLQSYTTEWKVEHIWEQTPTGINRLDLRHRTWVIRGGLTNKISLQGIPMSANKIILPIPQSFLNNLFASLVIVDGTPISEDNTITIQLMIANIVMKLSDFKAHQYHNAFITNLTHKIGTPLNGILYMGSLLSETTLDKTQREYMEIINRASISLASVVSDTVDISRLAFKQMRLKKEVISIQDCIDDSCQLVSSEANTKDIKINIDIDSSVPQYIYCDYRRLLQILYVLLKNSIAFNNKTDGTGMTVLSVQATLLPASDKSLDVESQNTHYSIEFTISDNGIGMSEKTCSDVLDSFWFHLDDLNISINSESDLQSSGLGLAIAQKLSQLMNGDLWVKLSELNQGSIFVFNIIASEDEYPEYIDHLSLKNIKNKHAIVVDTDSSVRVKLYNTLSKWGMECTLASSADEVTLAHLKNTRPIHIMFIKDQLLKTKGTELAKIIRSQGFQFPIVIITLAIENITTDSVVNAVLVSPIDEKDLMTTTIQLLSTKEHKTDIRDCEILIAEDDKSNQIVIEKILRRAGYSKITITNNGGEAYDEIQRNPYKYEVVLIDIRMPVIDGIKLSHLIYDMYQTLGNPESMPFMIGVSAQPIMNTSSIGKMQAFVAKPIVVKQLEEYINNHKLYMGRQSV